MKLVLCRKVIQLKFSRPFLRNITIVYFNKGSGMDNCPYRLKIL
jgi:hypothetical protein